jgi:hypothetical protein
MIDRSGTLGFPPSHGTGSVDVTAWHGSASAGHNLPVTYNTLIDEVMSKEEGHNWYLSDITRLARNGRLAACYYALSLPLTSGGHGAKFWICNVSERKPPVQWQVHGPFHPFGGDAQTFVRRQARGAAVMSALRAPDGGVRQASVLAVLGPHIQRTIIRGTEIKPLSMHRVACNWFSSQDISAVRTHMGTWVHDLNMIAYMAAAAAVVVAAALV